MNYKNKSKQLCAATLGLIFCGMIFGAGAANEDIAGYAARLNVEYERPPGVDYSAYDTLIINELDVSETRILPPPWAEGTPFKWDVSDKNVEALQKEFQAAMAEQISGNGGYDIVTEPGPGVIELTVRIVSFMPYAERKEKVITKGSGEMRISAELRDGGNGQLLAIYEGPQEVGQEYDENTDFARQENLKMLFASWGARVRISMDEDHDRN